MSGKTIIVLAGNYPGEAFEKFQKYFKNDSRIEFRKVEDPEDYAAMSDAEYIILRTFHAEKDDILRNKNLKMINRWGVGFDSVDVKTAGQNGVYVCNTPGANAYSVSELAVTHMLVLTHNILRHTFSMRQGIWSKQMYTEQTTTLKNKLVGIVGGGNIGRQVAAKVQAFGATVQYYDVFRLPEEKEEEFRMTYVSLEELLRTSDVISLHVPLTEQNHHMIGAEQFAMMKNGAYLINTARGGLVDENALIDAIESGKLAGAGIDCVEQEPLSGESRLLTYPNIVVTPHVGASSSDIADVMVPMIGANIIKCIETGKPDYIVNSQYF